MDCRLAVVTRDRAPCHSVTGPHVTRDRSHCHSVTMPHVTRDRASCHSVTEATVTAWQGPMSHMKGPNVTVWQGQMSQCDRAQSSNNLIIPIPNPPIIAGSNSGRPSCLFFSPTHLFKVEKSWYEPCSDCAVANMKADSKILPAACASVYLVSHTKETVSQTETKSNL